MAKRIVVTATREINPTDFDEDTDYYKNLFNENIWNNYNAVEAEDLRMLFVEPFDLADITIVSVELKELP